MAQRTLWRRVGVVGCCGLLAVAAAGHPAAAPAAAAGAAAPLPRLNSSTPTVTIEVDGVVETRGWLLSPELRPDVFEVRVSPGSTRTVRFVADSAALSFDVAAGAVHDFVIEHQGAECQTRIVGNPWVPPQGLELVFDFAHARLVAAAIAGGRLDGLAAADLAALPATAALQRKMNLRSVDELRAALQADAREASVKVAARTTLERLDGGDLAGLAATVRQRLEPYLPPGFAQRVEVFFLFGGRASGFAFGGDDVYVNLAKFADATSDEIAATVTHEVFHAVQSVVMPKFPSLAGGREATAAAGNAAVTAFLHNLAQEGSAELFSHVGPEGLDSPYARDIARKNERNAKRIAGIVTMFESLAFRLHAVPPRDATEYDQIYGLMFYESFDATAYQLGWVMARAIVERDGPPGLTRLLAAGPKAFVLRYQELAAADPALPRFGDRFLALVAGL